MGKGLFPGISAHFPLAKNESPGNLYVQERLRTWVFTSPTFVVEDSIEDRDGYGS